LAKVLVEIKEIENKMRNLAGLLEASVYKTRFRSKDSISFRREDKENKWLYASKYLYEWSDNIRYLSEKKNPFSLQYYIATNLEMKYELPAVEKKYGFLICDFCAERKIECQFCAKENKICSRSQLASQNQVIESSQNQLPESTD